MAAKVSLPVYVRVGDFGEARWGEITFAATGDQIDEADFRKQMAAFLRGALDVLENPTTDGEVPDAAAHG